MNHSELFPLLQWLDEKGYTRTRHMLESESGIFLDIVHLKGLILDGKFEEADKYLSFFINWRENQESKKLFFEIWKLSYLEALETKDAYKASKVLGNQLAEYCQNDLQVYHKMSAIKGLENFREVTEFSGHPSIKKARFVLAEYIEKSLKKHPVVSAKLQFPGLTETMIRRLHTMIMSLENERYTEVSYAEQFGHFRQMDQSEPDECSSTTFR